MKQGFKNILGLSLIAAMMGGSTGLTAGEKPVDRISFFNSGANPVFFGKSQKKKKTNKLNRSHKLKNKHRRAS